MEESQTTFPRSRVWLGAKTPGCWHLSQCSFHCVTHGPETQPTRHLVKKWARALATWMARLLKMGAGSPGGKAWRIIHVTEIYLQVATAVTHVAAWGGLGSGEQLTDSMNKGPDSLTKGDTRVTASWTSLRLHHMRPRTQSGKAHHAQGPLYSWGLIPHFTW